MLPFGHLSQSHLQEERADWRYCHVCVFLLFCVEQRKEAAIGDALGNLCLFHLVLPNGVSSFQK